MFKWGGKLKETVLWTNSSPTSSFAAQDVTISEAYSNYEYIAIYYKRTTSDTAELYSIFPKFQLDLYNERISGMFGTAQSASNRQSCARPFYFTNATTIHFVIGYLISSGSTTSNLMIPTKITGLKY